jgi:PERQ amino acid-rich with GYF domain-containing protein
MLNIDTAPLILPRKLSQSSLQPPLASPRDALPSPRRMGSGFDGVLNDSWSSRRRASEGLLKSNSRSGEGGDPQDSPKAAGIKEEDEDNVATSLQTSNSNSGISGYSSSSVENHLANGIGTDQTSTDLLSNGTLPDAPVQNATSSTPIQINTDAAVSGPPPGLMDPSLMEWSYLDPQGVVQGQCICQYHGGTT